MNEGTGILIIVPWVWDHIMGLPVIWSFYISKNLIIKILDKQTILLYTLKVKIKIKTRHSGDKK